MSEWQLQRMTIVGGGVMGGAICRSLLKSSVITARNMCVVDTDTAKHAAFTALGASVATDAGSAAEADVVLLAVKPQFYAGAAAALIGRLRPGTLVISIMAGITADRIAADLAGPSGPSLPVVRAMPNAAARVQQSATVWFANAVVSAEQAVAARTVFRAFGREWRVHQECYLNLATGLSGSGPAYLALAAEALIEGGVAVGLSRQMAHELVVQTLTGTALLLEEPGSYPGLVRESVTSPGGTTAAGLLCLEKAAVRAAFIEAVDASHHKSQELGAK